MALKASWARGWSHLSGWMSSDRRQYRFLTSPALASSATPTTSYASLSASPSRRPSSNLGNQKMRLQGKQLLMHIPLSCEYVVYRLSNDHNPNLEGKQHEYSSEAQHIKSLEFWDNLQMRAISATRASPPTPSSSSTSSGGGGPIRSSAASASSSAAICNRVAPSLALQNIMAILRSTV